MTCVLPLGMHAISEWYIKNKASNFLQIVVTYYCDRKLTKTEKPTKSVNALYGQNNNKIIQENVSLEKVTVMSKETNLFTILEVEI